MDTQSAERSHVKPNPRALFLGNFNFFREGEEESKGPRAQNGQPRGDFKVEATAPLLSGAGPYDKPPRRPEISSKPAPRVEPGP